MYYYIMDIDRYGGTVLDSYYELNITDGYDSSRLLTGITLNNLMKIFACSALIFGTAMCGLIHTLSSKCSNPVTASAVNIPLFALIIFCAKRYLSSSIYGKRGALMFKEEGLAVTAVIVFVCIVFVVFDYLKLRRKSF